MCNSFKRQGKQNRLGRNQIPQLVRRGGTKYAWMLYQQRFRFVRQGAECG